jgi:hypothetical protein
MASIKRWLVGEPVSPQRLAQIRAQLAAQQGAAGAIVTRRGAMAAGAVALGGTMAGQGGLNPPPVNAPPAGLPTPGVQPGVNSPVVFALFVLIFGPNNGLFEYSGTPALGNLEASITQASQDPQKNTTYPGIVSYDPDGTGGASSIAQLDSGQLNLGTGSQFAGTGGASPGAVTVTSAPGSGSQISLNSGEDSSTDNPAFLNVISQDAAGAGATTGYLQGSGPLQLLDGGPLPTGGGQCLYTNANGTPAAQTDNEFAGTIPITQTDVPATPGKVTQATFTNLSKQYTYPANDGNSTTVYRLTAWGDLTTPSSALQACRWQLAALGLSGASGLAEVSIAASALVASTTYEWRLTFDLIIKTAGSSGTVEAWANGSISVFGANLTGSNSFPLTSASGGTTANTTAASTIGLQAEWANTETNQQVQCYGSTLERIGA